MLEIAAQSAVPVCFFDYLSCKAHTRERLGVPVEKTREEQNSWASPGRLHRGYGCCTMLIVSSPFWKQILPNAAGLTAQQTRAGGACCTIWKRQMLLGRDGPSKAVLMFLELSKLDNQFSAYNRCGQWSCRETGGAFPYWFLPARQLFGAKPLTVREATALLGRI